MRPDSPFIIYYKIKNEPPQIVTSYRCAPIAACQRHRFGAWRSPWPREIEKGLVSKDRCNDGREKRSATCIPCQANTFTSSGTPAYVRDTWLCVAGVSADFYGPFQSGVYLLVMINEYSQYPVIEVVHSTNTNRHIPTFDKVFAMLGIPMSLKTNNGLPSVCYIRKICGFQTSTDCSTVATGDRRSRTIQTKSEEGDQIHTHWR